MLGLVFAMALENLFNFFPIRALPIVARRVIGLLAGPAIIAALCYLASGLDAPHIATSQLAIAAVVTSALGGYFAPQGASKPHARSSRQRFATRFQRLAPRPTPIYSYLLHDPG